MTAELLVSMAFMVSLLMVSGIVYSSHIRIINRIGLEADLKDFLADICTAYENPGMRIVKTYNLPPVTVEDGGIDGVSIPVFPACGEWNNSRVSLPIRVGAAIRVGGFHRLILVSGLDGESVTVEILSP